MSKSKVNKNRSSNESPYKIFSSGKNLRLEIDTISKSTINHKYILHKNKNKHNFMHSRPLTSKPTKDDREVSIISKKLKSMTLSNDLYSNYINYYCNLTQDHCFKTPRIINYPLRKNQKYLPITSQQNYCSASISCQDSIFVNSVKENMHDSKRIETKPYGFKYGETKIRIDRKRAKSAYTSSINPKDFQNLCETNIFESELLKQIGLQKIDMYNSKDEKNKNFSFFQKYLENLRISDDFFSLDNSYKNIKFYSRTSIIKQNIDFQLDIYSLCFKFYLLGTKEKPQKLYFPFQLMPLFYLLDFQIFKVFLSEVIYYNTNKNCFDFIENNLLLKKIQKYYNFIVNTIHNNEKYLNFISYNKNELCFYFIYDWIVSDNRDNTHKSFKLKISLPKIKFFINTHNIIINKHLNKHVIANLIINNFKDWEKFILFDLFSNKKFKSITNLIMLNKQRTIKTNKIRLNRDPNKELINNKKLEFYLTETNKKFSNFYIFEPYIILVLSGEKKKKYKKIHLSLIESKNLIKFKQYWGIINTLLKCMFIDNIKNEIFFRFDLLDNVTNDLYQIIIQENSKKNNGAHKLYVRKNSSKNSIVHIKDKDKDKEKNRTKYKTNDLEINVLDCTLKKINIFNDALESKYYKIPEKVFKSIFSIKNEKDLFNINFDEISIIGRCVGENSEDILNAVEENIINEVQNMKKKAQDPMIKSFDKFPDKIQFSSPGGSSKYQPNSLNRLKSFKISQNSSGKKEIFKKSDEISQKATMPNIKSIEIKNEKVNIKYKGDYNGFRQDNSKRKITISDKTDLNKKRISSEYSRFQIKKKITNKY
jgi:hypothetical protein